MFAVYSMDKDESHILYERLIHRMCVGDSMVGGGGGGGGLSPSSVVFMGLLTISLALKIIYYSFILYFFTFNVLPTVCAFVKIYLDLFTL